MAINKFVLIFLIMVCSPFVRAQSEKERQNNPNNFYMFEHAELTKDVFKKELRIIQKLESIRGVIVAKKKAIENYLTMLKPKAERPKILDHPVDAFLLVKRLAVHLKGLKLLPDFKTDLSEIKDMTLKDFPNMRDFEGAVKGMARLQNAYRLNLTALTDRRVMAFVDSRGREVEYKCHERLTSIDLATMGANALETKFYSTSVDFVKAAYYALASDQMMDSSRLKLLEQTKKALVQMHNGLLSKKETTFGADFQVLPYLIDEDTLERKRKQPKFVREKRFRAQEMNIEPMSRDGLFMNVCRKGRLSENNINSNKTFKCRYLHHGDPYLRLAPFNEEQVSSAPYTVVFRNILSEAEIRFLVDYSKPRLSRTRGEGRSKLDYADAIAEHEFREGKKRKIVHKTVQVWINEAIWHNNSARPADQTGPDHIAFPNLWKLNWKIKLATQLETRRSTSASPFQTTNYGLGGLCEVHIDPHGYIEGAEVPPAR